MNTPYDFDEAGALIARLLQLTRGARIEWSQDQWASLVSGPVLLRFRTPLGEDSEALIWSSDSAVGFRLIETAVGPASPPQSASVPRSGRLYVPTKNRASFGGLPDISERDLVAISIDHENGPSQGEIYVNLISLLELVRRSVDKVEPKLDRVKQYLDKLAV
jgi:hypothetical protein